MPGRLMTQLPRLPHPLVPQPQLHLRRLQPPLQPLPPLQHPQLLQPLMQAQQLLQRQILNQIVTNIFEDLITKGEEFGKTFFEAPIKVAGGFLQTWG
ncbi:uncharacterized protein LOC124632565 isoform X2 [Helicoverpa zea]|uniref:uncharacterized protein LOC124632565 isoform X2 n=1 Tax=Helicoverpa zea TaxID=7113 RepID=UPI001F56788B|nr:uncharacterized protein LOC124632565 isoform X2 [Helicoverpa zea]